MTPETTVPVRDSVSDPVLEMQGISKSFPGVKALDNTDLSVGSGEIHGLVGENGAGKSTLIKVLAGVYERDSGSVHINNQQIDQLTPLSIHDAGVRFIHQELHLVPHFSVSESVFMGQELAGVWGVRRGEMKRQAEAFLKNSLGTEISGNTLIRNLGVAQRKLVQIARALVDLNARLVVFDEPTAPLASGETDLVFSAIKRLKEQGISIIYVSHYLGEITELCDRVTVFRNGVNVAVVDDISDNSTDEIIHHMVGKEIHALYPDKKHRIGDSTLEICNLNVDQRFQNINLCIGKGEIFGLAGLIGSGREELVDTLYGIRQPSSGELHLNGEALKLTSPAQAIASGVVLVPRDRRNDGLVLDMDVSDNINLASLDSVATASLERRGLARRRAESISETLDIRPRNIRGIVRFLSGGNQQKVVLARWLTRGASVFILDEPTIGVDIGAKVEIYQLIENLAQQGAVVIVASSDPGELLGLCDRIAVLHRGEIIDVSCASEMSMDDLVTLTTAGARTESAL